MIVIPARDYFVQIYSCKINTAVTIYTSVCTSHKIVNSVSLFPAPVILLGALSGTERKNRSIAIIKQIFHQGSEFRLHDVQLFTSHRSQTKYSPGKRKRFFCCLKKQFYRRVANSSHMSLRQPVIQLKYCKSSIR